VTKAVSIWVLALAAILAAAAAIPQQETPADLSWAFPVPDKNPPSNFKEIVLRSVPGSDQTYPLLKIDPYNPPDWFPGEHPPMPPVVRHGAGKAVQACSYCHLESGDGHRRRFRRHRRGSPAFSGTGRASWLGNRPRHCGQ
jgi:hypothetical protein